MPYKPLLPLPRRRRWVCGSACARRPPPRRRSSSWWRRCWPRCPARSRSWPTTTAPRVSSSSARAAAAPRNGRRSWPRCGLLARFVALLLNAACFVASLCSMQGTQRRHRRADGSHGRGGASKILKRFISCIVYLLIKLDSKSINMHVYIKRIGNFGGSGFAVQLLELFGRPSNQAPWQSIRQLPQTGGARASPYCRNSACFPMRFGKASFNLHSF